jgi:putative holliday junction resolvase
MAANPQYILALDYGNARIGIAIASTIARLPRPLTTIANRPEMFTDIAKLVAQESVGLVVVGLPRTLDGGYSQQTHAAEGFAHDLATQLPGVLVELADETLTSVDAEAALKGKQHDKGAIDAMAATFILERYLSEHPANEVTA